MKNHYEILGVSQTCTQAEIKKAYRVMAVKYHPDKNNGDKQSEENFKAILESYIILSDEETRMEYDYFKGFKKGNKPQYSEPGKPSPIKYLVQIKRIKDAVLSAGGHVNKNVLYNAIDRLLSEENISFLIRKQDLSINHLIIDEALTCAIFIDENLKHEFHDRLLKLADGNVRMVNRINLLNKINDSITATNNPSIQQQPQEVKETPPTLIAIVIFVLFIILFLVFLYMENS